MVSSIAGACIAGSPTIRNCHSPQTFSGTIPAVLGSLKQMRIMFLHNAGLSGSLPSEIANCQNLTWFTVNGNNEMSGSLPNEFGLLGHLKEVSLGNVLSGTIPLEICDVEQLDFVCDKICGCDCPCLDHRNSATVSMPHNESAVSSVGILH